MGRSRPVVGLYVVGRVIAVLAPIILVVGCWSIPQTVPVVSEGSVTSEVTDVTQLIATDQRAIRWDYTVVLRETAGVGVQLQTIERGASGDRGDLMASTTKRDFQRRVEPSSELRFNESYTVTWTASVSTAFGNIPGSQRESYRRYLILRGIADDKTPVTVRIDVPLDARTGRRLEPPRVPTTLPSVRELKPGEVTALAGTWRGFYRNPDNIEIPSQLLVREDGSFEATEGEPVRNRFRGDLRIREGRVAYSTRNDTGMLTLHEAGERRILIGSAGGQRTGSPGTAPTIFRYALYFEAVTLVAPSAVVPLAPPVGPVNPAVPGPRALADLTGSYRGRLAGEVDGRPFTSQISLSVVQSGREISGTWTTAAGAGTLGAAPDR